VTPATSGENTILVTFRDAAGRTVNMVAAKLRLSLPAALIENAEIEGQAIAPGRHRFAASQMIIPGDWQLHIEGSVDDFTKAAVDLLVPIRPRTPATPAPSVS
jgi:nitrogen fixation protein FixH